MSDDFARRNLADMLAAKGASDADVEKMLGLVDEQCEKVAAEDRTRREALGLLVYRAVVHDPGPLWAYFSEDERAPYIAAAQAVEDKLEADAEEFYDEAERHREALEWIEGCFPDPGKRVTYSSPTKTLDDIRARVRDALHGGGES